MTSKIERTDVLIIGGGQAGLAMSCCLSDLGISHLVLERGRVGERWRSERWPSLRLLTPAWMTRLPGFTLPGVDPSTYLSSGAFVQALDRYAATIRAPLRTGTEVTSLRSGGQGYIVATNRGVVDARAVVMATGACDTPHVPSWASDLPEHLHQVTPDRFRRASLLPVGGVLVVGASATGVQLAVDIARSGRPVTLAVGRHVRAPRRYRGRDLFEWLDVSGFLAEPRPKAADPARLRSQPSLPLLGDAGIDLADLSDMGVKIVGRALGVEDGVVRFADSLAEEQARAELRRRHLLRTIDAHIERSGLQVPPDPDAWRDPPALPEPVSRIPLAAAGIRTVVWATGYRRDYRWLHVPVLGADGEIETEDGTTAMPGLYALGLPFMRHRASAFIDGVGRDAEALAHIISNHLDQPCVLAA